jgi:hypothetical protein
MLDARNACILKLEVGGRVKKEGRIAGSEKYDRYMGKKRRRKEEKDVGSKTLELACVVLCYVC